MKFIADPVTAMHVPRCPGNVQRFATVVAFDETDHLRRPRTRIDIPADSQSCIQPQRNFRLHVGQLGLDQLRRSQRPTELLAVQHILPRPSPTIFRSEEHTSELQSLMRISYAVFCLKKKNKKKH